MSDEFPKPLDTGTRGERQTTKQLPQERLGQFLDSYRQPQDPQAWVARPGNKQAALVPDG